MSQQNATVDEENKREKKEGYGSIGWSESKNASENIHKCQS